MVTCSGNSAGNSMEIPRKYDGNITGNSTDKQPQNKDSLTKEYKTEIGKTHERYTKENLHSLNYGVLIPLVKQKTEIVTE